MKKLIFCLALCFAIGKTTIAQDTSGTRYMYYPNTNTYYNSGTSEYSYYDKSTGKWSTGKNLPQGVTNSTNAHHYNVYYNGTDVWSDNKTHQSKYKTTGMNNGTRPKSNGMSNGTSSGTSTGTGRSSANGTSGNSTTPATTPTDPAKVKGN